MGRIQNEREKERKGRSKKMEEMQFTENKENIKKITCTY